MDRKALIRQYKETRRPMGVFRVFNTVADRSFVGSSKDLPSVLNRERFQLSHGSHPDPSGSLGPGQRQGCPAGGRAVVGAAAVQQGLQAVEGRWSILSCRPGGAEALVRSVPAADPQCWAGIGGRWHEGDVRRRGPSRCQWRSGIATRPLARADYAKAGRSAGLAPGTRDYSVGPRAVLWLLRVPSSVSKAASACRRILSTTGEWRVSWSPRNVEFEGEGLYYRNRKGAALP